MPSEYKPLTDEQVKAIALDYYGKRAGKTEAQDEPRMVLVGGQPGAGKSEASALAKTELREQGGYIHVDADRMRERIPLGDSKPTSEQTQKDASRLVTELRGLAVANRRNILEEGTFRQPHDAERFVAGKQAQGYKVEMLAVATPREQSLLGIYNRHELQHEQKAENPRMVPEKYHDEAMQGFESTLAKAGATLDRTRVIDRGGNVLFDSQTNQRSNVLEALAEGRKLTDAKLKDTAAVWAETREMAAQRNAPASYQATLKEHHERIEAMQKDRIHGHAMKQLDTNAATLTKDPRYTQHTGAELAKAAYFRGFHEKASEFKGIAPDFTKYDATASNRQTLKQLPDVTELEGRAVQRTQQRSSDGHSL